MTLGLCVIPYKTMSETWHWYQYEIPCKTISGIWHWHRYETSCKTIAGLSASICVIPCKTISGIWHWHLTMCTSFLEYPLVF
ncbi:Pentafunctional AROM polypeptide [Gossypium arboreum]|uniref:Pentafunctional AROM polypeptide n=1 Tax=Gossypium arboreum TaxID=29729 RepID=A0A0B0NIR9_GOSAR|nr:Pentafunctional AROM polypeptide [Gossypium arboreum]